MIGITPEREGKSSPAGPNATGGRIAVDAVRREFPILSREVYPGTPLVYLDSAATSLKPASVIAAVTEQYRWHTASVHRGLYRLAEEATEAYEQARERVAAFIRAPAARQVIFTRGTTEGINLVARSWCRKCIGPGDAILISELEHHSNLVPWQQAAGETGAELRFIPLTSDGQLDLAAFDSLIAKQVKLVAVASVSNVLGTVNPIERIVATAHAVGARVLVDGAQGVPHRQTDVTAWDCDFLAFSGHKMCGPDGVGVLYGKEELLEEMPPLMTGGQMIRRVARSGAEWNELPWKFEAGTPPIASVIGLGAAVEFLERIGMDAIERHGAELCSLAYARLSEIEGIRILGPAPPHRSGIVSFAIEGMHPHDLAQLLDRRGVAIRAGHHCAQPLHDQLGLAASARASFYLYNTIDEIDRFVEGLREARRFFHR
jgi:cysteine desulfurase/selenocysteine lyase